MILNTKEQKSFEYRLGPVIQPIWTMQYKYFNLVTNAQFWTQNQNFEIDSSFIIQRISNSEKKHLMKLVLRLTWVKFEK